MISVFSVGWVFEAVDADTVVVAVSVVCATDMVHIDGDSAVDAKL